MLKPIPQTGITDGPVEPSSPPHDRGMTVRNMSPATQRSYVSAVSKFSRYFAKSPERLSLENSSQLRRSPTTTLWHIDAVERGPSTHQEL